MHTGGSDLPAQEHLLARDILTLTYNVWLQRKALTICNVALIRILKTGGSEDFEIMSPRDIFAQKWESHHTKEYSLL